MADSSVELLVPLMAALSAVLLVCYSVDQWAACLVVSWVAQWDDEMADVTAAMLGSYWVVPRAGYWAAE